MFSALPHIAVVFITKAMEFFLTLPVEWKCWFSPYFTIGKMTRVKLYDKIKSGNSSPNCRPQGPVSHVDSVLVTLGFSPSSEHLFLAPWWLLTFSAGIYGVRSHWLGCHCWIILQTNPWCTEYKTHKEVCWVHPGHQQSTHLIAHSPPWPTGGGRVSEEQNWENSWVKIKTV